MSQRYALGVALLAAALSVGAAGVASAQDVTYNALPEHDFSKYKTYRWVTVDGAQKIDDITDKQIMDAIDRQLAAKGLTRTADDKVDVLVAYQAAIDQEKQLNAYTSGGYGWGWRGYGYGGGMATTTTTTSTILIGMVNIDVYDAEAKQLVWRGRASKTIDTKANPEKRQKNIDKAMTKLLKNYPPPVKK
jgi:hypothetical protein